MGQLQKRFEQQAQAEYVSAPEASVQWKPGSVPSGESSQHQPKVRPVQVPRWHMRALFLGGVIIVSLLAVLLLG